MPLTVREPAVFVISNRLPVTLERTEDVKYETSSSSGGLCLTKISKEGLDTRGSQVLFQEIAVDVLTCPIGTDLSEFPKTLSEPAATERMEVLKERFKDVQLIISVDRLDYIKGIPLRISAIDALLTKHAECVGKVPSREDVESYQLLHTQIDESVSRVNGKYGEVDITPIQSLFSGVSKPELAALYAISDACIISSTRDGLNLVYFGHIACQQERHGVLLLSEFAGSAEFLQDSLQFNLWNVDEFAGAIYQLKMSKAERAHRWKRLWEWVSVNTASRWSEIFLKTLGVLNK
ncbi:uncharacterized protein TRUGW13939_09520 [Talaromyces rugulosus]|uniref:Uncharacterized protein n=1 Tax=Talaromyces rugulosus TaxID=121627 RepID=A0A7H8R9F5_TALRU|nr:uncharacterized protein TRUGW13939_09520 [Talaromyces rugulosus]QKX62361.1 hypothetical protein TRUGW13939_09520 [Talaromyces rugulosus]